MVPNSNEARCFAPGPVVVGSSSSELSSSTTDQSSSSGRVRVLREIGELMPVGCVGGAAAA